MKNIRSMSYRELYNEFKIILNLKYIENVIKDKDTLMEFYKGFEEIRLNGGSNEEFVKKFFEKNAGAINNEAYIFYTLKSILENKRIEFMPILEKCQEALKDSKYAHYELNEDSDIWYDIKRVTGKELATGIVDEKFDDNKNKKRIDKLTQKIDLKSFLTVASITEMDNIYGKNKSLNGLITRIGMVDTLSQIMVISDKDKRELLNNSTKLADLFEEHQDEVNDRGIDEFMEKIALYIEKYPEAFDIDEFILIGAYKAHSYLELINLSEEENEKCANMLLLCKDNIESHSLKVTGLSSMNPEGSRTHTYSYNALEEACKRISKSGKYLSLMKEEELMDHFMDVPNDIVNEDPEIVRLLKFDKLEYNEMLKSDDVLYYLVTNELLPKKELDNLLKTNLSGRPGFLKLVEEGYFNKKQIETYIKNNQIIEEKLFGILDSQKLISAEEKLEYYMNGFITSEELDNMDEEDKLKMSEILSISDLIKFHKDKSMQNEYIKYASLFRKLVLTNSSKEDKEKIAEDIIEEIGTDIDDDELVRLYKEYLIPISTVADWGGSQLITQMMRDAILKPIDVKEICANGNYDSVIKIMKDKDISRKNKLAIFYTTFADHADTLTDEEEQKRNEAKKECLLAMGIYYESTGRTSGTNRIFNPISENKKEKSDEYVLDPIERWTLIKLLDEDYSYEMLDQGMMIFKLPNLNGGTVILEKMFRKEKPEYGRATKVLNISFEEFDNIKDDLIVNGDIPVSKIATHPKLIDKVEDFVHSANWGGHVAEYFDYQTDSRRSKENVQKIDNAIKDIIKSRSLRDK